MSNPVPQQQNASTNRPSMTLGCWITGCLFALLLPFLLCFTNFGFFITYYYVLSKFDQAFSHVESRTTIIQSVVATILFFVVSLGVGVALGFRDKSQERNKQPTSNLTTRTAIYIGNTYLIIKSAIPLVPLALSHSEETRSIPSRWSECSCVSAYIVGLTSLHSWFLGLGDFHCKPDDRCCINRHDILPHCLE